jgi:Type II secretion system (T2SS), protein E, N-terminal domain
VENAVVYDRGDRKGRPGINTSLSNIVDTTQAIDECASLVQITASAKCVPALLQAAGRIRRTIRRNDTLLFLEQVCAIGLPATSLQGAQSVARRVKTLLVEVDCDIQTFYGMSALTHWQRMLSQRPLVVDAKDAEESQTEHPHTFPTAQQAYVNAPAQSMPYLAFLASYPSRRILHLFPYELACRHQCVPVGAEHDMLTIGTSQQLDESVIAHMREVTRRGIFQVRCDVSMIDDVLRYWQSAQKLPSRLV